MAQPVWAKKSLHDMPTPTVAQHCHDVLQAADAIYSAIRSDLTKALGLDASTIEQVHSLLRAAALLHDVGKANSSFQAMLRAKPTETTRQPVRHEIVGAWLLADPDFYGLWFGAVREPNELWSIIWAIAGHHLKMGDPAGGATLFNAGSGTKTVEILCAHAEVRDLFTEAASVLGVRNDPPQIANVKFETADDDEDGLEQRINRFAETSCRTWNRLRRDPRAVRASSLLKALLIAADVAGSALTADAKQPQEWIPSQLEARLRHEDLQAIIDKGTRGQPVHSFQEAVAASATPATIVIAGCGNGKTTAAYLWAQRQAQGRKLWFTYPTTGTASAGYQGYLYDHPDLRSVLIHSRAHVDLEAIRGNDSSDEDQEWLRLESLRAWGGQVIACTVDTVLGLLQNQRRPLFSFPAIAAGAFVFDEIHSYDGRLFGSLLRFLETFPGIPVLLMSASIPPTRLAALQKALGHRVGAEIRGDPTIECYKRYRLESGVSSEACRNEVRAALNGDNKVLWVCNTVSDAVNEARAASQWSGLPREGIVIYHSRFRYRDRVERQARVLNEFAYESAARDRRRMMPGPRLVFATQVCEMSLDISADLLVTAECPLPSLVQRLGRLNRYATENDPWPCLIYPFQGDPYNEIAELVQIRGDSRTGMNAMRDFVRSIAGQPCSQRDLADRLNQMTEAEEFEDYSAWLDDGWLTEPAQVRDADTGITLIREEDLSEISATLGPEYARPSKWTSARLVPWTIPMLHHRAFQPLRRIGGYAVAPAGTVNYSEAEGASWAGNRKF